MMTGWRGFPTIFAKDPCDDVVAATAVKPTMIELAASGISTGLPARQQRRPQLR